MLSVEVSIAPKEMTMVYVKCAACNDHVGAADFSELCSELVFRRWAIADRLGSLSMYCDLCSDGISGRMWRGVALMTREPVIRSLMKRDDNG